MLERYWQQAIEYVRREWRVIRKAPLFVLSTALIVALIVWKVSEFNYSRQMAIKDATIQNLQASKGQKSQSELKVEAIVLAAEINRLVDQRDAERPLPPNELDAERERRQTGSTHYESYDSVTVHFYNRTFPDRVFVLVERLKLSGENTKDIDPILQKKPDLAMIKTIATELKSIGSR